MERQFRVTFEVHRREEPAWAILLHVEAEDHADAMEVAWAGLRKYPEQYNVTCTRIEEMVTVPVDPNKPTGPVVTKPLVIETKARMKDLLDDPWPDNLTGPPRWPEAEA